MTDHLAIWQKLEKTDPEHVKNFQRPGGFRGHAIRPIYAEHKMTEVFGPCGIGWGTRHPDYRIIEAAEETAVYCTVTLWYRHGEREGEVVGVGGDMVRKRTKNGFIVDDEAFKKAFTDALTNAMKHLGMSADVHMGLYDDSKYVAKLRREQQNGQPEQSPPGTVPADVERELANALDEIPDEPLPEPGEVPPAEKARKLWREVSHVKSLAQLADIDKRERDFIHNLPDDIRKPLIQHIQDKAAKLRDAA